MNLKTFLTPTHLDDELPHLVRQKRVYILPTKSGLLFCLMLFIMFLVSLNNNNNLGLLLTFLLSSMFLTSMIYTHSNLMGLKILSLVAKPTYAGEELEIICSVFSPKIARPLVSLSLPKQNRITVRLEEALNQQVKISADNLHRGRYKPNTIIIETEFPFSFFRAWTYLKTDLECLIYPQPLSNSYQDQTLDQQSDTQTKNLSKKGSDDFDGLKTYQSGDPLKQIYWKGFSRGVGLHSKTYSGEGTETLLFDFDSLTAEDLEKRLSILTFKVNQANQQGSRFALKLPKQTIGPNQGEAHTKNCLKALALFCEQHA